MNYFSEDELRCRCCGVYEFDKKMLRILNDIRVSCGFPLPVTSGYRCLAHPIEAAKAIPGAHTTGMAVDIAVRGEKAYKVIQAALEHGVTRIGVNQKGNSRFIHLDIADIDPSPTVWSY